MSQKDYNVVVHRHSTKYIFFSDKIYEARHELLKLTTPLVRANIPRTYFSKLDLADEFAFRQALALMPNRSESPLATSQHHLLGQSFTAAQLDALSPALARMNLRNNFNNNLLSPHVNQQVNMSPRNSISPITSGYNSAHNSFNSGSNTSMDAQMSLFQQSQNGFLDTRLSDNIATFDEEKTPTLLDVKVRVGSCFFVH